MIKIIQNRRIWLTLSGLLMLISVISLFLFRINFGIDFTGGSLLEVEFKSMRPSVQEVQDSLTDLDLGSLIVQPVDEKGLILRFQSTSEEKHQDALRRLNSLVAKNTELINDVSNTQKDNNKSSSTENLVDIEGDNTDNLTITTNETDEALEESPDAEMAGLEELRFDSVGPVIGQELKQKSITAMVIVLIAIVLYIAWTFRKVSKPVASWKYGITAIIALFHDVVITMGAFSILGKIYSIEVNTAFVAAILTVVGYSVNDTIVVFDRIRENLPKSDDNFENTVNSSVNQTITRSLNTSITTLIVLLSILFFGGSTIRDFILALSIGVFIGTYSSIFLASPILVVWEKFTKK